MIDDRYSRHVRFAPLGAEGQRRLADGRVLIVGCGALGSAAAEQLARAGLASIRLVDRDFVELSNLQRQCLYTEADAAACRPKAVAAAEHLQAINSACAYDPVVAQVGPDTMAGLLTDIDLVIDGTDNFATRHVVNDACCQAGIPWIYAACVGAYALSLPILPGDTPCLRCLQDELPAAGDGPTCDSVGIIAPAVHVAASLQVAEALKILAGQAEAVRRELWACDLWQGTFQQLGLAGARDPACRSCGTEADFPALAEHEAPATVLCGRDAVQLNIRRLPDLDGFATSLGDRLQAANAYLVKWQDGDVRGAVFKDGRVLVQGVDSVDSARAFADRWLG